MTMMNALSVQLAVLLLPTAAVIALATLVNQAGMIMMR
jgi:hypothetical protein